MGAPIGSQCKSFMTGVYGLILLFLVETKRAAQFCTRCSLSICRLQLGKTQYKLPQ